MQHLTVKINIGMKLSDQCVQLSLHCKIGQYFDFYTE